ncbi:U1 snRNP protein [Coemansia sp. RSA 25]|nr:U1 snRNP protein [Coemansia sp. RSA 25]
MESQEEGSRGANSGQPAPWVEYTTPTGRVYYFNPTTKKTTWEKPDELKSEQERLSVWKEYAKDGRTYWYNTETKKSTWTRPAELGASSSSAASAPPMIAVVIQPPVSSAVVEPVGETPAILATNTPQQQQQQAARPSSPPADHSQRMGGHLPPVPPAAGLERHRVPRREYRTHEEAEEAFLGLLSVHKVGSDWTWEQTLREVVSDPDYRSLRTLQERKEAFHKYTSKLRDKEREESRERAKQQREDFFAMMRELPISEVTRFRKVRHLAAEHPAFIAAGRDGERLFGEFMDEFARKTREQRRAVQGESMRVLSEHLSGLPLGAKWNDVKVELLDKFGHLLMPALRDTAAAGTVATVPIDTPYMYGADTDPEAGLSLLDFMDAFERAISAAERREVEACQKDKDSELSCQRQHRDAFRQLLDKHQAHITPASTWTRFFPLIKADQRYIDMLGQPGSTPLDLFWDHVELLEEEAYRERKRLESVMRDAGFKLQVDTARSEVKAFATEFCQTPDIHFDYIYEQLLMKVKRKKEEEDERLQRQRRRFLDDLKYALYDLQPPLRADSVWDEEKERISRLPEFRDIADEPACREVFDRVVEREQERELARNSHRSRDSELHKRSRSSSEVAGPPDSRTVRPRTSSDANNSGDVEAPHQNNGANMSVDGHDSELEEGEMVV